MLYEISRRQIHLNKDKHEEPTICWYNSVLCVKANKHLSFFDFSYNLQSWDKKIDFNETSVKCFNNSPVTTQFLNGYMKKGIKNSEMVEMITNPTMWPHSKLLKSEMGNFKSFKCSPDNLIYQYQNIISVVNNFGNVNFIASNRCAYKDLLDFTTIIKRHIQEEIPENISQMKKTAYRLSTSAVCWAPVLNSDNSCYFVTAQKSGHILFWSISTNLNVIEEKFCGSYDSGTTDEVEFMLWIPLSYNIFMLVCSNNIGQLLGYEYLVENNQVLLRKKCYLWEHKDKMIVKQLHYSNNEDKFIIIFNKNRHVITQLYDRNFESLSQDCLQVNDEKITSITKSKDGFYLGILNTKIYKLNIVVLNENLKVTTELLEIKEIYQNQELYGMGFSRDNAILALLVKDQRLLPRKEALKLEIIFLCFDNTLDSDYTIILNNPSEKFTQIWDHIELLRCKIMRSKMIPEFDYKNLLLEGNYNLYKLKVYYLILMFYTALKMSRTIEHTIMPNTNVDEIREKIIVTQAVNLINSIYNIYRNDQEIKYFKSECFYGAKKYLLYYCNKYKKSIEDLIKKEMLDINDLNVENICQCCDNKLDGFTCKLGHLNMFCSLTFKQINSSQYLICKGCGSTATPELYNEKPICLFCDIHFVYYDMIV